MKNKIGLILLSLLVLSVSFQEQRVNALTTKVATKVATQAFKEVVKDAATQKAFKMALDAVGGIYNPGDKYEFKDGYDTVCVTRVKANGSCDTPIQIKKDMTDADKAKLDSSVTKKMDSKIGGSLYATKWGKWLDWAVPIYAISAAGVALDYAINGEDSVAGMINEIAMEALEDAEIITPAIKLVPDIADEQGILIEPGEPVIVDGTIENVSSYESAREIIHENIGTTTKQYTHTAQLPPVRAFVMVHDRESRGEGVLTQNLDQYFGTSYSESREFKISSAGEAVFYQDLGSPVTVKLNGKTIYENPNNGSAANKHITHPDIKVSPIKKAIYEFPVRDSSSQFYDHIETSIFILENGDVYRITDYKAWTFTRPAPSGYRFYETLQPQMQTANKIELYPPGSRLVFTDYEPNWIRDLPTMEEIPIDYSQFKKNENTLMFPPMDSMEIMDTTTGLPGTISKNPTTGETEITDSTGQPINEDNIGVAPGTGYTPTSDGEGITYTPGTPTTENPTQDPVTIPKTDPSIPPPVTPPTEPPPEEPPLSEFPEGEKCGAKLQFPIFSPLKETFSTSFPFSIPWDIERAINAAFSEIGNEKPSFELPLKFNGNEHVIEMTMPKFFDNWKPFTDSLLLIIFDIMIMFGVYRFVKGAGS